jgi:hypothetical protein
VETRCEHATETRRPFFGDTHVHTYLSLDANLQGTRLSPADAYRFAKGEAVGIQPYDAQGQATRQLQLGRPLDFAMVSDHAAFLGTVDLCSTPGSAAYDEEGCGVFRDDPDFAFLSINSELANPPDFAGYPPLCGEDGEACLTAGIDVWGEIRDAAEAAYDRTEVCSFTSFVGYEWSGNPSALNLHRNVVFANEHVPDLPVSYFDAPVVEDFWEALRDGCDAVEGCDVLAIPHNSNLSNGTMFLPMSEVEAPALQAELEPLIEVYQHKGDSECWPGSTLSDELCDFEKLPYNGLAGANLDINGTPRPLDFVRDVLAEGLRFEASGQVNPYRFGIVASTDTHLAAPGSTSEDDYAGHGGAGRSNREEVPEGLPDNPTFSPGGLAVLWAEENSREALFRAMKRREAYGTSGPRITLRFFGTREDASAACGKEDLAAWGYAAGVPMGGTLSEGEGTPSFVIAAQADPGDATQEMVPLERLQVVKGTLVDGEPVVEVFDVAGAPATDVVDLSTCDVGNDGAASLCGTWSDPSFDPSVPTFWYVRAIEVPTCRWTTRQCVAAGITCPTDDPAWTGCCDERAQPIVQERAWSSPIWSRPEAG